MNTWKNAFIIIAVIYGIMFGIWAFLFLPSAANPKDALSVLPIFFFISLIFVTAVVVLALKDTVMKNRGVSQAENTRLGSLFLISPWMILVSVGFILGGWNIARSTHQIVSFLAGALLSHTLGIWLIFLLYFPQYAPKIPKPGRKQKKTGRWQFLLLFIIIFILNPVVRYILKVNPPVTAFVLGAVSVGSFYTFIRLFLVSLVRKTA